MGKRWKYMGDVNLEYGGTFYDFSNWKYGYVDAIEVIDLDSACGFRGAVMVEPITINVERSPEQLKKALSGIGAAFVDNGDINDNGRIIRKGTAAFRFILAYACQSYGYKDCDPHTCLQLEADGPMEFEGWRAEKRLRSNASLENYVRKHFLRAD